MSQGLGESLVVTCLVACGLAVYAAADYLQPVQWIGVRLAPTGLPDASFPGTAHPVGTIGAAPLEPVHPRPDHAEAASDASAGH